MEINKQQQPIASERLRKALDFGNENALSQSPPASAPAPDRANLSQPEDRSNAVPTGYLSALSSILEETPSAPAAEKPPVSAQTHQALKLPSGYKSLEKLGTVLAGKEKRFSSETADGRSSKALALAIGGTEVYGKGTHGTDFFTRRGGTNNNMLGFGQFNLRYHRGSTNTPEKYTRLMADILNGKKPMPNGRPGSNHARALSEGVQSGRIQSGADLVKFMKQRGFGGSNWQGIDDGWGRNPGLANALVKYLRENRDN